MSIKAIHIAPTSLIAFMDTHYNKGLNMVLTHLVLKDSNYREEVKRLRGEKYLDNSFFELGYSLPPRDIMEAAELVNATVLICPDGTTAGLKEFKSAGYKVMCIPKTKEQFKFFMYSEEVDLVGLSEEHFAYRHCPGIRYEVLRDNLSSDMPTKKIHLLGATDSIWELGMLSVFRDYIFSWDSSAAIWQGHLGNLLRYQTRKDTTSVDFSKEVKWNLFMDQNVKFIKELLI